MPKNSNFWLPSGHRFFANNRRYGYGAKSRLGPPRVHLGANGVPLVKQWVKIVKNYHALNSNFWLPRGHLGANGVPFGPKNGSQPKKLPCPQIQIFCYPAVIVFSQKIEVTVMAPNQGGDPLGFILGPMVSHWVKNWFKTQGYFVIKQNETNI